MVSMRGSEREELKCKDEGASPLLRYSYRGYSVNSRRGVITYCAKKHEQLQSERTAARVSVRVRARVAMGAAQSTQEELLLKKLQAGVITQEEYDHIARLARFESEHDAAITARGSADSALKSGAIDSGEHAQLVQRLTVGAEMNEQALLRSLFDLGGRAAPRRMSDLDEYDRARFTEKTEHAKAAGAEEAEAAGGDDDDDDDESSVFVSQFDSQFDDDDETEDTAFVLAGSEDSDDGYAANETVLSIGNISAALREATAPELSTPPAAVALGVMLSNLAIEPSALVRELVLTGGGRGGVSAVRRHEFIHSALAAVSSCAPPQERLVAGRAVSAFADELWLVDTAQRKRARTRKMQSLVHAEVYSEEKARRARDEARWGGVIEYGTWTYRNVSGATLGVRTTPDYPGVKMSLGLEPGHVFTVHKRVRKVVKQRAEVGAAAAEAEEGAQRAQAERTVTFLLLDHVREVMAVSVIAYKARLKAEEARRRVKSRKRRRWGRFGRRGAGRSAGRGAGHDAAPLLAEEGEGWVFAALPTTGRELCVCESGCAISASQAAAATLAAAQEQKAAAKAREAARRARPERELASIAQLLAPPQLRAAPPTRTAVDIVLRDGGPLGARLCTVLLPNENRVVVDCVDIVMGSALARLGVRSGDWLERIGATSLDLLGLFDADGDGRVTEAELAAALAAVDALGAQPSGARAARPKTSADFARDAAEAMAEFDADFDGTLIFSFVCLFFCSSYIRAFAHVIFCVSSSYLVT